MNATNVFMEIENNLTRIRSFGVKEIALFGSYLKGNYNSKSDIDILVEFKEYTFDNYFGLKFFLEDLFDKEVDLVIKKNIKKELKYVIKEAKYAK